jgi:peptidoglycan/xylan/chitin deacetylase (PgdA/CDA1 family)
MNIYFKIKRKIASLLIKKKSSSNLLQPFVSFTFDDVHKSALTTGADILNKYNYCGTYYIALGIMESQNLFGTNVETKYLDEIISKGNELGCHTYNHISFYRTNKEELIADLNKNQEKISELISGYQFKNFSYPYGEITYNSLKIVRERYSSARSTNSGINQGRVNLINLKSVELNDITPLELIYALIEKTIQLNGWLILNTHDIEQTPSKWGCSPDYYEAVIKYCYEKKIAVKTISEVTEIIK